MPVTLGDVAAATGLSLPSVSQILNGKGSYRPETRERVATAARSLGYQPNANARAMVSRRFGCCALVLSSRPSSSLLPTGVAEAVDEALARVGQHLILARLPDERLNDPGYIPKILSHVMADGLIINYNAGVPRVLIDLIRRHGVPAVWLNSLQEHDAVRPDDRATGDAMAARLLAHGHTRIAWLDANHGPDENSSHYSTAHRRDAFREAIARAGITARHLGREGGVPFHERLGWLSTILAQPDRPTAIACYGPQDAELACASTLAAGLQVPRDLSLITCSDRVFMFAGRNHDTLVLNGSAIGRMAVERLTARIAGGEPLPPIVLPPIESWRGSVGPPPA